MTGTTIFKKQKKFPIIQDSESRLEGEFKQMFEGRLNVKLNPHKPDKVWLVDEATLKDLISDASKFYEELGELKKINDQTRKLIAAQLSCDKSKYPIHMLHEESVGLALGDMQEARKITGIRRVTNPRDYIPSYVSFLVNSGKLPRELAEGTVATANETLTKFHEIKETSSYLPRVLSAAAIYHALYSVRNPIGTETLKELLGISPTTLYGVSRIIVKTARPDELDDWVRNRSYRALPQKAL